MESPRENPISTPYDLNSPQGKFDHALATNQPDLLVKAIIEDLKSDRELAVPVADTLRRFGDSIRAETTARFSGVPVEERYDRQTRRGFDGMKVLAYDLVSLSQEVQSKEEAITTLEKMYTLLQQEAQSPNHE